MSIDTSKIKIKEAKGKVQTFKAPDGMMYLIDEDGNAKLVGEGRSKTKSSIGPDGNAKLVGEGRSKTKSSIGPDGKTFAGGGLAEATARLKAKGMKDGGMVVKEKIVAIDTSPNSGLITVKGFGAGRRT